MVIEVRLLQPAKALSPMVVIEFGIVMVVKRFLQLKAFAPIPVTR